MGNIEFIMLLKLDDDNYFRNLLSDNVERIYRQLLGTMVVFTNYYYSWFTVH